MQYANGREIRENVNMQLEKMNIKLFDHYKQPFIMDVNEDEETHDELRLALKNGEYDKVEAYKEIRSYDLSLIDRSDFVIFVYDPEVVDLWKLGRVLYCKPNEETYFLCECSWKK